MRIYVIGRDAGDPDAIDQMREQAFGLCMEVGGLRADQVLTVIEIFACFETTFSRTNYVLAHS